MFCAIGVGNSTVKLRFYLHQEDHPTIYFSHDHKLSQNLAEAIKKEFVNHLAHDIVIDVGIVSVVPQLSKDLVDYLQNSFNNQLKIKVITSTMVPNINIKYQPRDSIGIDRLIGAYEATSLYHLPLMTIDMGTANTINVVNEKKELIGGIIFPGMEISFNLLREKTAQINEKIHFSKPTDIIGNNTKDGILSGVYYSQLYTLERFVKEISKKSQHQYTIVVTGGNARHFIHDFQFQFYHHPNLVLDGIFRLCTSSF